MSKLRLFRAKVEAASTVSEVAGKNIGRYGLFYITIIVLVGVGASLYLDESKIAAVIGLVSAALTGIIAMLAKVAETPTADFPLPEVPQSDIPSLDEVQPENK